MNMNSNRTNYVLKASLLCLSLLMGGTTAVTAQNNARSPQGGVQSRRAAVVAQGVVVDDMGDPLPGATVRVRGTKLATTTDSKGRFSVTMPPLESGKSYYLDFNFVGMEKKSVRFRDGSTNIRVSMESSSNTLDEVEVVETGYGRLPRKDMVGAFTTVKADDIMMPAYQTIDQMLQGKIAGLMVVNSSTRVGATPKITIRGKSTILGNTDPLWVVDGVIQEDPISIDASAAVTEDMKELIGNQVSWLNPQDIETITVLKDASATAIYGSKASNGVIVITTKKGSAERTSIRYSTHFSIRQRPNYNMYDYMNSLERIQFSKEAYDAGARYQSEPLPQIYTYEGLMAMFNKHMISEADFAKQMQRLETVNTDWFSLLCRNSLSQSHNLSISGGTKKVTYNASFGYSNTKGTEKGNDQNQFTARLNVGIQFNQAIRASFNVSGSSRNSYGYSGVSPHSYALTTSRAVPAFNEDGSRAFYKSYYTYQLNKTLGGNNTYGYNVLNEMDNSYSKNRGNTFNVSANLDFQLFPWLSYQVVGSMAYSGNAAESYQGERTSAIEQLYRGYPVGGAEPGSDLYKAALMPFGGKLTNNNNDMTSLDMQHKLVASHTFNEIHRLNGMFGWEMRSAKTNGKNTTAFGYVPERGESLIAPSQPEDIVPIGGTQSIGWGALRQLYEGGWSSTNVTSNYMSFFGTVAYSLMNRYVVNANIRSDASNRFGQDVKKQFDPTYSFGFSWKIAEEKFFKEHVKWVDQLNLRATYGIQGNVVNSVSPELISSYGKLLTGYNEYYSTISSLPNPYLKWERTRTWNLGLDLGLFHGVTMNLEYYGRRSNAIIEQDVAEEYGMGTLRLNGGIIYNHGIEWSMNITPVHTKDWTVNIGLNASKNWNKTETDDRTTRADELTHRDFISGNSSRPLRKGYSLYAFWAYDFTGLEHETGLPTFRSATLKKVTDDKTIDPTTFLVYAGESEPYFTGGINPRVRYKSFQLSASFALILGSKKRLPNPYASFTNGKLPSPISNLSKRLLNRWKQPGDEATTNIPGLYTSVLDKLNLYTPDGYYTNRYDMWYNSTANLVSGSFLRCSQLSFTYHFPKSICQKIHAQGISVSGNTNNIFVIASKKWNGFDPETGSSRQPRIVSFGLSVSF